MRCEICIFFDKNCFATSVAVFMPTNKLFYYRSLLLVAIT